MTARQWPLVYFLRHGQTNWNKEQRFQGQRDIPLNDYGREQAKQNGAILRSLIERDGAKPHDFDWFCSPLGRTRETLEIARGQFDGELPEVTYDDRLIEISFGILEGVLLTGMEKDFPAEFAARSRSKWHHLPPEGENYEMVLARLEDFGKTLSRPAIITAHGGIARALRHFLCDTPTEELDDWHAPQDKIMCFGNGEFSIIGT